MADRPTTAQQAQKNHPLIRRARKALANLSTLSNGATTRKPDASAITTRARSSSTDPKGRALKASDRSRPTHTPGSRVPNGVRLTAAVDTWRTAPSLARDPYEWFRSRFEAALQANDAALFELLCVEADAYYRREIKGNRRGRNENEKVRDARIVREYRGVPSWKAAVYEDCHPQAIERARRLAGLELEFGDDLIEHDERTGQMIELRKQGLTYAQIAAKLGMSKARVGQILKDAV